MRDRGTLTRNGHAIPPPPPSYEASTYRRLWPIVAPYVQSGDLYSACLVSRQFHREFSPFLWGNPASRFGTSSDNIYLSLTRFKRLLVRARLDVRSLTHTLEIPPAHSELYDGPQAGWLRDILDRLPSLQALIVSNLSVFDHQSLQTVHQGNKAYHALRLLIASNCANVTAASLSTTLSHFPDLLYLDLSSTQGSRSPLVLQQIHTLTQLCVLKMRNCGLRDYDIELLSLPGRLRSLDFSDNYLTEKGICSLIERLPEANLSIKKPSMSFRPRYRTNSSKRLTIQTFVRSRLTSGLDGHLLIEDGISSNFADLYLAGNFVTMDDLSRILNYPSIECLDCGSLNCSQRPDQLLSPGSPGSDRRRFSAAAIGGLSPALFSEAFRNIRSLRIHHSVITSYPFSGTDLPVSEQCFELHSDDLRYELDSTELIPPGTVFELDDTSINIVPEPIDSGDSAEPTADPLGKPDVHPTFERPDDVGTLLSPSICVRSESKGTNEVVVPKEISSLPEKHLPPRIFISSESGQKKSHPVHEIHPVQPANHEQPIRHVHSTPSAPSGPETYRYKYAVGAEHRWSEAAQNKSNPTNLKELIEEVKQRRHRTEARERHPGRFKPSMLPNLKVLTLTDVPSTTRRRNVIEALISFMQECAEEENLARLEELDSQDSQNQLVPQIGGSGGLLKLQRLVLEMSLNPDPVGPPLSAGDKILSFTKSSTEDPDSESFMEATESDFSFFGEDDGGLLVHEGRIDSPVMVDDGMIVNAFLFNATDTGHPMDVVSELAGFRRQMKAKHEAAVKLGTCQTETALLGHWFGEVKVIKDYISA